MYINICHFIYFLSKMQKRHQFYRICLRCLIINNEKIIWRAYLALPFKRTTSLCVYHFINIDFNTMILVLLWSACPLKALQMLRLIESFHNGYLIEPIDKSSTLQKFALCRSKLSANFLITVIAHLWLIMFMQTFGMRIQINVK